MSSQSIDAPTMAQVVYDRTTGRSLGRFRQLDVTGSRQTGESEGARPPDEVLALFGKDEGVLARVTDGDPRNLAVLATELPAGARLGDWRVSRKRGALVERPRLRLSAEREVLEGDGEDAVTVRVEVVDGRGRTLRDGGPGEVHLTTSRGKLSARGGRLELERGEGRLTLTSVRETVDRVRLRVRDPGGIAAGDEIILSFA